jgi:hypothetical protein
MTGVLPDATNPGRALCPYSGGQAVDRGPVRVAAGATRRILMPRRCMDPSHGSGTEHSRQLGRGVKAHFGENPANPARRPRDQLRPTRDRPCLLALPLLSCPRSLRLDPELDPERGFPSASGPALRRGRTARREHGGRPECCLGRAASPPAQGPATVEILED